MQLDVYTQNDAMEKAVLARTSNEKFIVCGSVDSQEYLAEQLEIDDSPTEVIIKKSKNISPLEWFLKKRAEFENDWSINLTENEGAWPDEISAEQSFALTNKKISGKAHKELLTSSLTVTDSWEIMAHFQYGGYNDCPFPEEHCAVWKYWQEKYDAHIIGISHDVVEAFVGRPPATQKGAMELAWEQYLYSYHIVHQGTETISNLAASILHHPFWYFWWD